MNDLQICNENQALIDMQINACNTAVDFFETNLKKGQRDFITQMGQLSIKAKEIQLEEDRLRQQYAITEIQEENKYRLATIDFRKTEVEAKRDLRIEEERTNQDRIKEQSNCIQASIDAAKDIELETIKIEQLRIKEQSECLKKLIDSVQEAYDKKFDFYESQLKFCMEFFSPQIQSLNQRIAILTEQYNSNFENQEAHMMVHKQLKRLERARSDINDKVESIVANLTTASKLAKLEFGNSVSGYIR